MEAPSARTETSKDADHVKVVQVGVAVTPPTLTDTERVFSLHVPLTG